MRILKGLSTIQAIAGEMINIETSTLHYIDGEVTESGPNYRGYPQIKDNDSIFENNGSIGFIFVAGGTNLETFEENLMVEIKKLDAKYRALDGKNPEVLRQYHSIRSSYHTNVKIQSSQNLCKLTDFDETRRVKHAEKSNNVKRQFCQSTYDEKRGRFTWFIQPISEFDFKITSENIQLAIARYVCSIFYDTDDICTLPHNTVTFTFARSDLIGSARMVDEQVRLFSHGHPLLVQLSDYWKHSGRTSARDFLRNIPANKIYTYPFDRFSFHPVSFGNSETDSSTGICAKCRGTLWGDNYALAGNVNDPDNPLCTAICPLCMHSTAEEKPIEKKFYRIFRVTFPHTAQDMLASPDTTEDLRDICTEAMKSVSIKSLYTNDREVTYALIGDKYVGFENTDHFLFTKLSVIDDFKGRKVCGVVLIR